MSILLSLALADLNMATFLQKLTGGIGAGANTKLLASLVQVGYSVCVTFVSILCTELLS